MNYTDMMNNLKTASLFDLFRLRAAISLELENPDRIKSVRLSFKVGDSLSFFDERENRLRSGIVIEKNTKYVSLRENRQNAYHLWKVPYCFLNLSGVDTNIHHQHQDKLSKNNLKIGDQVGFNRDGESIYGIITRLNYKTVSLTTAKGDCWRVGYGHLHKIIDVDSIEHIPETALIE